jgi:hypothetical protein
MTRGERSHDHFPPININRDFPLWNHPRDFPKHTDASWAPDNPFSGHTNLKQQHDASKHRATSQPCIAQDRAKIEIFYNAHKHRTYESHEEFTPRCFAQSTYQTVAIASSSPLFVKRRAYNDTAGQVQPRLTRNN